MCDQHGGNSPGQVAKAAARRQAAAIESDAQALLGFDLSGSVGDAHAALDALAAMQLAIVEASARRVNAAMSMRYTNDRGDEQLRSEYAFMHQAIAQAHRILDTVAKHAPDSGATAAKNLLTSLAEKLDDLA